MTRRLRQHPTWPFAQFVFTDGQCMPVLTTDVLRQRLPERALIFHSFCRDPAKYDQWRHLVCFVVIHPVAVVHALNIEDARAARPA